MVPNNNINNNYNNNINNNINSPQNTQSNNNSINQNEMNYQENSGFLGLRFPRISRFKWFNKRPKLKDEPEVIELGAPREHEEPSTSSRSGHDFDQEVDQEHSPRVFDTHIAVLYDRYVNLKERISNKIRDRIMAFMQDDLENRVDQDEMDVEGGYSVPTDSTYDGLVLILTIALGFILRLPSMWFLGCLLFLLYGNFKKKILKWGFINIGLTMLSISYVIYMWSYNDPDLFLIKLPLRSVLMSRTHYIKGEEGALKYQGKDALLVTIEGNKDLKWTLIHKDTQHNLKHGNFSDTLLIDSKLIPKGTDMIRLNNEFVVKGLVIISAKFKTKHLTPKQTYEKPKSHHYPLHHKPSEKPFDISFECYPIESNAIRVDERHLDQDNNTTGYSKNMEYREDKDNKEVNDEQSFFNNDNNEDNKDETISKLDVDDYCFDRSDNSIKYNNEENKEDNLEKMKNNEKENTENKENKNKNKKEENKEEKENKQIYIGVDAIVNEENVTRIYNLRKLCKCSLVYVPKKDMDVITMEAHNAFIEFYVSLVTYTVMHMIFVISSDFVEAFNIPPLNIGIYVDKLAAIRALLMVIADIFEWQATKKDYSMPKALKDLKNNLGEGQGCRRIASLLSFLAMLVCRSVYLWIVYKSDNKSLSVFITLCIEGFWFGTFQMSFFAIGPEYNAFTSLGIHTMGNFIFFLQLILNRLAKKYPSINCLSRVRVHGWTCLITSIIALALWIYFCYDVTAEDDDAPSEWPTEYDVWSPLLLFIVGAFAEDFSVPGILPFAFLDPEKANLVNYLTPVFFMSGAIVTVFANDIFTGGKGFAKNLGIFGLNAGFKDWSASTAPDADLGQYWHSLWLLNIPKYIAFFIAMFSIHGTFADLRCVIQSRWRVMLLTLNVVIPRATLETAGYVGVANWAIGRANGVLVQAEIGRTEAASLKDNVTGINMAAETLSNTLNNSTELKKVIEKWVKGEYGATVNNPTSGGITITQDSGGTGSGNIKVTLTGGDLTGNNDGTSDQAVALTSGNKDISVTINLSNRGSLKQTGGNADKAKAIADKIASVVALGALANKLKTDISNETSLTTNKLAGGSTGLGKSEVKTAINEYIKVRYNGAEVQSPTTTGITVSEETTGIPNMLKVVLQPTTGGTTIAKGEGSIGLDFYDNDAGKGVKVEININSKGNLNENGTDKNNNEAASEIAQAIKSAALGAAKGKGRIDAFQDFGAFAYIAYHDILAMFCIFVYGKFAVGYNWTVE